MPVSRFSLFVGAAASFAIAPGAAAQLLGGHSGQVFISPMGEPFRANERADALAGWFRQADANHDGSLSADEMAADAERFFRTLDTTHDGEIDPDEVQHYEDAIAVSSGDSEAGAGRLGLLQIPEPVISADTDFNRGVSAAEFRRAAIKRFALLDVNHTGRLTLDELYGVRSAASAAARRPPREKSQKVGLEPPQQ